MINHNQCLTLEFMKMVAKKLKKYMNKIMGKLLQINQSLLNSLKINLTIVYF